MLICNNHLNEVQLQALNHLAASCRATDGGSPPLYSYILEQKRVTKNNFLYYEQDQLVGFLSVYFFYPEACELTVLVAPTHRRRGISKQLIQASMPLLKTKEMRTLIFSTPEVINESWLLSLGFLYKNSEYHMERNSYEPVLLARETLIFRKATPIDIPALCSIDALCFEKAQDSMPERLVNLLNDSNYSLFIALYNEKAVGKAHIRWHGGNAVLSDLAIIPPYQGQGLGSELLAHCINETLTLGKTRLALDVETSNHSALNLYTRHGFKTVNAIDYWTIDIDKVRRFIES